MLKLQKVDYTGKRIYIGIDVHKKSWMTRVKYESYISKAKCFVPDPKAFAKHFKKEYPGAKLEAVYEAGFSGFWIHEELTKLGIKTIVVNPADVPTKAKELTNKTDRIDAKKLVETLASKQIEGIYVPTTEQQQERDVLRQRRILVKKQTMTKNRIKSYLDMYGLQIPEKFSEPGTHWSKNFISWLESIQFSTSYGSDVMASHIRTLKFLRQEIALVTKKIRKMSESKRYKKRHKLLRSVPGIGLITAMTLLTEIVDISRFKRLKHLTSYIGIAPREHSSGEKRRVGGLSKRGNNNLRQAIIESSWVAIKEDPALAKYYAEAKRKVKSQKAIIKTARKLVSRIRYVLKNEEEYIIGIK